MFEQIKRTLHIPLTQKDPGKAEAARIFDRMSITAWEYGHKLSSLGPLFQLLNLRVKQGFQIRSLRFDLDLL